MAIDPKKMRSRWKEAQKARRKVTKRAVKTSNTSTGNATLDAAKLIEKVALRRVITGLPSYMRTKWTKGSAEHQTTGSGHMRLDVRLEHKDGHVVKEYVLVPSSVITQQSNTNALINVAHELADRIIHHIRNHHTEDARDGEARQASSPKPEATVVRELLTGEFIETKIKKAVRPFCIQCGKEDRSKFPEWGPCPHEEAGEI